MRCIKPNGIKKPRVFDSRDVALQLTCGGVFEAIRIMRDMYPSRITHEEFYRRFNTHEWKCIMQRGKNWKAYRPLPGNNFDDFESLRLSCLGICQALDLKEDRFQVGRSKVFFRTGVLAQLEERVQKYIFSSASTIRARYLGWVQRRQYKKIRTSALTISKYIRRFLAMAKYRKMRRTRAGALCFFFFFASSSMPRSSCFAPLSLQRSSFRRPGASSPACRASARWCTW